MATYGYARVSTMGFLPILAKPPIQVWVIN